MARQSTSVVDGDLIARAMNFLLDRAKEGEHGLQYMPRGSIFLSLARFLRIPEPGARRLVAELQERKLIILHNVGPGPRLIVVKPPPAEPARHRRRRKQTRPAPGKELNLVPEPPADVAAPSEKRYAESEVIDRIVQLQREIDEREELKMRLLIALGNIDRSIPLRSGLMGEAES